MSRKNFFLALIVLSAICLGSGFLWAWDDSKDVPLTERSREELSRYFHEYRDDFHAMKTEELSRKYYEAYKTFADSAHAYDVLHYELDIVFDIPDPSLSGVVIVRCRSNESGLSNISLHFVALTVDGVRRDGMSVGYDHVNGELYIDLNGTFDAGEEFEVAVTYLGTPAAGYWHGNDFFFTSVEPSLSRYWWPCFDEPWDKATADISATVPAGYIVASNGVLIETIENTVDNTITYSWSESYPIATYLVSVAIARYVTFSDTYYPVTGGDPMEVIFYTPSYLFSASQYDFGRTVEMIECFVPLFGEYPFLDEKYGTAVAPMSGAMEHQTCTTWMNGWVTGDREREWTVAHELAHQWWGDMVTLLDWRHMWLNEGFAVYSEALWAEYLYGEEGLRIYTELAIQEYFQNWEDSSPANRHPIYDPPPGALFSPAQYEKGGSVLHMLRFVVGTDLFFESIRTYGQRYMYGNATTDDLKAVFEEVTGEELDWFFEQWIYSPGYPEYQFMWETEDIGGGMHEVTVHVNQIQTNAPVFTMPVEFNVFTRNGEVIDTVVIDQAFQSFQITVDAAPDSVFLDRFGWILKDVTTITSPLLSYTEYSVDDEAGNSDGRPDPGETVHLTVSLRNTGVDATGVVVTLVTQDPDIMITDNVSEYGSIAYGEIGTNADDPFVFQVESECLSKMALFIVTVSSDNGYTASDSIYLSVGPATILIVDDDFGEMYEEYYTKGFATIYPIDVWDVALEGVPVNTLPDYEAVVWFTGDDRTSTLTSEEQAVLKEYLDGGGNLLVTGQNIGYDLVGEGSIEDAVFYHDYLHAEYVSDTAPGDIVTGVDGDPISGDIVFLSLGAGGAGNQNSPSVIEPFPGATPVFTYQGYGEAAAVRYSGEHKVVYFAFGYEGVGAFGADHAKVRTSLMDHVVRWFRHEPQKGDVNEDGTVNILDVVVAVNIILGLVEPTEGQYWAADYTENGEVDILDVVNIVNAILGSPTSVK
ncbi:MAG: hypothetical protein JSV84_09330 [Gemmatimonadota bacterium]|nr:MAG: hypothetical protein JSV84_09330 [Gemmatimonadota bacterium]